VLVTAKPAQKPLRFRPSKLLSQADRESTETLAQNQMFLSRSVSTSDDEFKVATPSFL
jgi:hypothetical protein